MHDLQKQFPGKTFYISGCLAQRFDIPFEGLFPRSVARLVSLKSDYTQIKKHYVDYVDPFWVHPDTWAYAQTPANLEVGAVKQDSGLLFRHDYPMRVGSGCAGNCTYCSVKHLRGTPTTLDPDKLLREFMENPSVVAISDNPTAKQLKEWCAIAHDHKKPISFRNVEPATYWAVWDEIRDLAAYGMLRTIHIPIQHTDPQALEKMGRNPDDVIKLLSCSPEEGSFARLSVCTAVATSVIEEYPHGDLDMTTPLCNVKYISKNLYWDGNWDVVRAATRFVGAFPWRKYQVKEFMESKALWMVSEARSFSVYTSRRFDEPMRPG